MPIFKKINGIEVGFGLAWMADNKGKKAEAAFVNARKANYQLRYAIGGQLTFAAARYIGKQAAKREVFAGAAMFAAWVANHNAQNAEEGGSVWEGQSLLALKISEGADGAEGQVALIALLKNEVYRDTVIDESLVADAVAELINETGFDFDQFSNLPGTLPEAAPFHMEYLVRGTNIKLAKMTPVRSVSLVKVMGYATVALAIVGGVAAWQVQKKRAAEAAEQQHVDPVQAYEANAAPMLAKAILGGQAASTGIWGSVARLETSSAGWTLTRIDCDRQACKQFWKRKNGTNADFQAAHQGSGTVYFPAKDSAELTVPVKAAMTAVPRKELPTRADVEMKYTSLDQALQPMAATAAVSYTVEPPAVFGLPPEVQAADLPKGVAVLRGKITITAPIGFYPGMLLELPSNISVARMDIALQGGVSGSTVTLTGDYFAK